MVNAMEPRYPVVTREHLTGLYTETKAHVKASLASMERVALTCDGLTLGTTEAYVTVMAHFINEEWELVTYVFQTRDMPESHTDTTWQNFCVRPSLSGESQRRIQ